MSQENVEVVRAIYDSIASRGIEGSLDLIDPDFELKGVGQGPITGTYRGPEGVRAFFAALYDVWDEDATEYVIRELHDAGDQVVAVGELHTRFKATGMELDEIWAYVWTVRDGKATAMQSYTDPRGALEASGLAE
jgi:ketosteroid isomerase-like protein